jgi:hypothetical protein
LRDHRSDLSDGQDHDPMAASIEKERFPGSRTLESVQGMLGRTSEPGARESSAPAPVELATGVREIDWTLRQTS